MTLGEAVLEAFINANILIVVAYGLWCGARFLLKSAGLQHSYATQLKLLNAVFLTVVCAPFLVPLFQFLQQQGVANQINLNLSDMVVSYYLSGGIEMKATEFESLLQLRHTFTGNVVNGAGWLAQGAIAVFALGVLIGGVRLFYSMFCLHRIVRHSYAWRHFGRVHIRLSDRTLVPFSTRGWRNCYIVIPSHMLVQTDALKVSLAHELQHVRQGDLEWEIALEALKPFFFLNPAYHAWKRRVEDLRELSCDGEVLARGRVNARRYCDTLLSVCQTALRRDRAFVIAVPKVTLVTADRSSFRDGRMSQLEHRITTLLEGRRIRHPKLIYAAVVLPLVAAIVLTALAIQRPADWSQDRLTLSTVVNLERLDEINRLSTFGRLRN
ncbi:MAG: M56 family metallopeptidase [Paracoccaceae bacterium]